MRYYSYLCTMERYVVRYKVAPNPFAPFYLKKSRTLYRKQDAIYFAQRMRGQGAKFVEILDDKNQNIRF